MEKKQKVDVTVGLVLLFISIVMLVLPLFNVSNLNIIMPLVFGLYSIVNIIQYLLTKESKDKEGMYTTFASLVAMLESIIFNMNENYKLTALLLMTWITFMSLIKLKKADYYHDKNDRMWKIRSLTLVLFILSGLLTSVNLFYDNEIRLIIIGYFFFIHAILEIIDPIIKTLIKHS